MHELFMFPISNRVRRVEYTTEPIRISANRRTDSTIAKRTNNDLQNTTQKTKDFIFRVT